MSHEFPPGGRIPDEVLFHLHEALKRRGWLGQVGELSGRLRTTKYWLMAGVVATGSLVHVLESITSCEPPGRSA